MSTFDTRVFEEPPLEFGDRHSHPDPRLGLFEAGPLQPFVGDVIKIGVVGSAKTVEDTRKFLETVSAGVEGKSEKHPNMHPAFPGLGNQSPTGAGSRSRMAPRRRCRRASSTGSPRSRIT